MLKRNNLTTTMTKRDSYTRYKVIYLSTINTNTKSNIIRYDPLTWIRALSCSLRSSRQTLWTSSGCRRASSHTFQRWCSEQQLAFPTSKLKTEENRREKKEDWRHHETARRQRVMLLLLLLRQLHVWRTAGVSLLQQAVNVWKRCAHYLNDYTRVNPTCQVTHELRRSLNEPERPMTNNQQPLGQNRRRQQGEHWPTVPLKTNSRDRRSHTHSSKHFFLYIICKSFT